jgi:hypothetical protein
MTKVTLQILQLLWLGKKGLQQEWKSQPVKPQDAFMAIAVFATEYRHRLNYILDNTHSCNRGYKLLMLVHVALRIPYNRPHNN